jgi:hypothetical protein
MADFKDPIPVGSYEDNEWRELAADPEARVGSNKKITDRREARYAAGPLQHPFGPDAYRGEVEGVEYWFENRDAFRQYEQKLGKVAKSEVSATHPAPLDAEITKKTRDEQVRKGVGRTAT